MKLIYMLLAIGVFACKHPRPAQIPGSTDVEVDAVSISSIDGTGLPLSFGLLMPKLGHRVPNIILPPRHFNAFRLAEDKRRIVTFASNHGYFDIEVAPPVVTKKNTKVSIAWKVQLGEPYRIGEMKLVGAPPEAEAQLLATIPFRDGSPIEIGVYRLLRHKLADVVRSHGYSHARVYTRGWVDRKRKVLDWYYFADPGPKTHIASLSVVGNHRVPSGEILRRSGLEVGQPYGSVEKGKAQIRLLDYGSMVSVVLVADDDVHKGPPELPDSGGKALVDENGDLAPRDLSAGLHVVISVVEAPSRQLRVSAGAQVDPFRSDLYADARLVFRDIQKAGLHAVVEGYVGYGVALGGSSQPLGAYGEAKFHLQKSSLFGTRNDGALSAMFSREFFVGAAVSEVSVGPSVRRSIGLETYLDVALLGVAAQETTPLPVDADLRKEVGLSEAFESYGGVLQLAVVNDSRDNGIEASAGHFWAGYAEWSPPLLGASHQWLRLKGDVRGFRPVGGPFSVAARVSGQWVLAQGDSGTPLHKRLFGGGAYGFRGFARQRFSPKRSGQFVGASSLVESSLELRFLPVQKLYGAAAFLDLGGSSIHANSFSDGISAAVGLSAKLRTFYIPISFDLSVLTIDKNSLVSPGSLYPWSFFVRLGEAF